MGRSSCIQQCFVSRLKPPLWNKRCGEIQLYTTVLYQPSEASTVEREVWGDPAVCNSALSAVRSHHCGTRGVGRSSCMQQCFVSCTEPPLWNERCGEIRLYTTVLCQLYGASTVEREMCGEIQLYATVLCQLYEASTVEQDMLGDPSVCNSALSASLASSPICGSSVLSDIRGVVLCDVSSS